MFNVTVQFYLELRKIKRFFSFPVVTWRSDRGALLLRGAGFHVRSVVSRLKQQATYQSSNK